MFRISFRFLFHFSFKTQGSLQTEFFLKKLSNKDLKALHWQLYWEKWHVCILGLEQLRESSGSLKTINTSKSFEWPIWTFMKSLHNFMVILKFWTIMFNESLFITLSQFVAIPYRVSIRKSNLKFCAVTSAKGTHQIPKNQISVTESLRAYFHW